MAKTERLYIRINPAIKNQATALFDNMDITITDAVTLFLQKSLDSGGLPFDVEQSSTKEEFVKSSSAK